MTKKQKLELRRSAIRERLGEIAGLAGDALTDEIRSEQDSLETEYRDTERQLRAATIAEDGDPNEPRPAAVEDGEPAEIRALVRRAELRGYMTAAAAGRDVAPASAEAELRAAIFGDTAREFAGVAVPWAALAPERQAEARADAATSLPGNITTSVSLMQRSYIPRVFAGGVTDFLGVSMDSVGAGEVSHLVLSAGVSPEQKAEGAGKDAEAATIAATVLEPTRLTAGYLFRVEDMARSRGLEPALRADLAAAMRSRMDYYVLRGDGDAPEPSGFLDDTSGSLAAPTDTQAALPTFAETVGFAADAIDGLYAPMMSDVHTLMGPSAYAVAAKTFTPNGDISAATYLSRQAGGLRSTAHMPAPADVSGKDYEQAVIARRGVGRNAVAAVWEGLELIRDPYSGAAKGQVALRAIALWDFAILRAAAFKRIRVRVEA